jgi:hypothetical protein
MQFSNEQMDAAVLKFRSFRTSDEFYRELSESPEFKATLEAAYHRDPSFMRVDAAGWRPTQFNVDIPPARPNEHDPFGPGADPEKMKRMKPLPGAAIF